MYFKLMAGQDPNLSWIIAKNPTSPPYERDVGNAEAKRKVVGRFVEDGYEVVVINDGVAFLERMKAENEAAYVRAEVWLVCPGNLKGFSDTFRSAIYGKKGNLTDEVFFARKQLSAVMGPFPIPVVTQQPDDNCVGTPAGDCISEEPCMHSNPPANLPRAKVPARFARDAFKDVGLAIKLDDEGMGGTREACMLRIETVEPMTVTEFLQKIYIVSMALTMKYNWAGTIEESLIDKFLGLAKGWLGSCPNKDKIIAQLSGYKKSLVKRLADGLPKEEEEEAAEPEEAPAAGCEGETKISLHERRHTLIVERVPADAKLVIDFGSGEGKLMARVLSTFPEVHVLGVDANRERLVRTQRKLWRAIRIASKATATAAPGEREDNRKAKEEKRFRVIHDNLLYPHAPDQLVGADVLVASEVIEHMEAPDRARFIEVMRDLVAPKIIMITTPNIDYNEKFGMPPGTLRHHDHRIEYTYVQLEQEVLIPLSQDYTIEMVKVLPDEDVQPSFFVLATRRADAKKAESPRIRRDAARMGEPLYLEMSNVTVKPSELLEGYTAYPFLANARNIFYLGPTMAPTDYSEFAPSHLEHPVGCFEYFRKRGVRYLAQEPKYMGSRGYVLVFREEEHARMMGFDGPIVVNARSGGAFFKDPAQLAAIYADIRPKLKDDMVALDAEILPWRIKADRLIAKDFRLPGEAALLWRDRVQPEGVRAAMDFLRVVEHYGADSPLEIRAFHVLAAGSVKVKGPRAFFNNVRLGFYRSHADQLLEIKQLEGDIIKPTPFRIVDNESAMDCGASTVEWEKFCAEGGEGFVYKPAQFLVYDESGYMRQPAMKVRGTDYLRIIYGMDYTKPEYLERLKKRGTWAKRKLAIQEQEMAIRILRTFVHHNEVERLRAIGAFLGVDDLRGADIDKTL